MFGSDDHKQDNHDDVDQAAAAAANDHGSFDDNQAPAPSGDTPLPTPAVESAPTDNPASAPAPAGPANDELLNIKQEALKQLSPLVGHLDQSPEEKFRTTMMMIQASDDQNLVKAAYEAAQAITDEKARAQALLDIINEINYFTQNHAG